MHKKLYIYVQQLYMYVRTCVRIYTEGTIDGGGVPCVCDGGQKVSRVLVAKRICIRRCRCSERVYFNF